MKLIHTADLHIGKQFYGYNLYPDQEFVLNAICDIALREHADGIIIAGDVFDTPVASRTAVDLLNRFLTRPNAFIMAAASWTAAAFTSTASTTTTVMSGLWM